MDTFERKEYSPMLIKSMKQPFDSSDWCYEIKWDGIRCLAYLSDKTELINKRGKALLPHVPELAELHKYVNCKCVLDGELMVFKKGTPDFYEIQSRAMMTNAGKIAIRSGLYPASFLAYDILYIDGRELLDMKLLERKEMLKKAVVKQDDRFAVSKHMIGTGIALFEQTKQQNLEGVVAKRLDSKYQCGKRSDNWVKFKNMTDEDYVVCGYVPKDNNMTSIILGLYDNGQLTYRGHVTLGVNINTLLKHKPVIIDHPDFPIPPSHDDAVWFAPQLVCIVQYMSNEKNSLRQPVFKGIRNDKDPKECICPYSI